MIEIYILEGMSVITMTTTASKQYSIHLNFYFIFKSRI